jgi:uncharacterized protein YciI
MANSKTINVRRKHRKRLKKLKEKRKLQKMIAKKK